jgi:hypothetical protein
MAISITAPIDQAIDRTKIILFKPFEAGKWFKLGFCAFLAQLGGGGSHVNFNLPVGRGGVPAPTGVPPSLADWWQDNAAWLLPAIALGIIIAIALGVLLIWLKSRGKFMFLDGIVENRAAVVEPWKRCAPLADNLFGFTLLCVVVAMAGFILVAGAGLAVAWPDIQASQFTGRSLAVIITVSSFFLIGGLAVTVFFLLLNDFVVPAMYLRGERVMEAWRTVNREVFAGHVGRIVLFYLMRLLLGLGIGVMTVLATCLTCCLAALPYIGAVILLPFTVFMRAYTLHFLEQFGPQWTFFVADDTLYCRHCGYNLTGNVSGVCPECGTPITPPSMPPPRS